VADSKFAKYIVTEITPRVKQLSYEGKPKDIPADKATRLFWLDDYVIKGAFYTESVWIWKGSDEVVEQAHTHDFDEVISFLGTNFDGFVKSPLIVMPDLIRHPEPVEFTGFRLPPE